MARARIAIKSPADLAAMLRQAKVRTAAPLPGKRSKYRAQRAVYAGLPYDSRAEAAYARWLDSEVEGGRVLWWVRAPTFHLGCPENVYRPDFLVVRPLLVQLPALPNVRYTRAAGDAICVDDVKGKETPKFKRDKKLWAAYGPTTLRVVKLSLNYGRVDEHGLPSIRKVEYTEIPGGMNT